MSVMLITGWFPIYKDGYDNGEKEFLVSHGVDIDTGEHIVTGNFNPKLSEDCYFDQLFEEWFLKEK